MAARVRAFLAAILLFCWSFPASAADIAGPRHMLWRVAAGKSVVYLFGTIYVGNK